MILWHGEAEEVEEEILVWQSAPPEKQNMARLVNVFAKYDLFGSIRFIQDRSPWLEAQKQLGRQSHGTLELKKTFENT